MSVLSVSFSVGSAQENVPIVQSSTQAVRCTTVRPEEKGKELARAGKSCGESVSSVSVLARTQRWKSPVGSSSGEGADGT